MKIIIAALNRNIASLRAHCHHKEAAHKIDLETEIDKWVINVKTDN